MAIFNSYVKLPEANQNGGFLKWGVPKSPWISIRAAMVIHDDWMKRVGYPTHGKRTPPHEGSQCPSFIFGIEGWP
jgi:hypothetical protein